MFKDVRQRDSFHFHCKDISYDIKSNVYLSKENVIFIA